MPHSTLFGKPDKNLFVNIFVESAIPTTTIESSSSKAPGNFFIFVNF